MELTGVEDLGSVRQLAQSCIRLHSGATNNENAARRHSTGRERGLWATHAVSL